MSKNGQYIQYYVEGQDEEKILSVLKTDLQLILSGRVSKFNVVQNRLTRARLMNLRPGTMVVLVFDTDTNNSKILKENIDILKKFSTVYCVVCITQVRNLEDELVRSCNIKTVRELTGSKTDSEYKSKLIAATNLAALLTKHRFDIKKFWSQKPDGLFSEFVNEADLIKK